MFHSFMSAITPYLIVLCWLVLSACGKVAQGEGTRTDPQQALTIAAQGSQLAFDTATLQVQGGNEIKLTLKNNSNNFKHNWVLVNGNTEIADAVYKAALAAGEQSDFLPDTMNAVLTHTALVAAGQQETIAFTAPVVPGSYTFLCTFPGHYLAGMKGTLMVTTPE